MRKLLIGTVGLPRSGKTTWARSRGWPIVNPDSIRLALHGVRFRSEAEPMVWVMAKYMVKSLFLAGHDKVILDATNVTVERRRQWSDPDWDVFWQLVDTHPSVCVERARSQDDDLLVPVIERMASQMECFLPGENLWSLPKDPFLHRSHVPGQPPRKVYPEWPNPSPTSPST